MFWNNEGGLIYIYKVGVNNKNNSIYINSTHI